MWIREGLEKLEKKKQKKQDHGEEDDTKKSSVNLSASGSSSIAGYDHGKVDSPVRTPKSNDSEEVHILSLLKKTTVINFVTIEVCYFIVARPDLKMNSWFNVLNSTVIIDNMCCTGSFTFDGCSCLILHALFIWLSL